MIGLETSVRDASSPHRSDRRLSMPAKSSLPFVAFFMARVSPDPVSGCWIWTGAICSSGYGEMGMGVRGCREYAHRLAYVLFRGPLGKNSHTHHLCGNHACANPGHLEQVGVAEHFRIHAPERLASKPTPTHCPHGHEYTVKNTYRNKRGWMFCKACHLRSRRERRARRKASL